MAKVDSLIFASMVEINRIFKSEGDSAGFQKPDPDNELDKKVS